MHGYYSGVHFWVKSGQRHRVSHNSRGEGQVVSVLAFYPTIRVRIPLKPKVFSVQFVFEKNESHQKEGGDGKLKTAQQRTTCAYSY